MPVRSAAIFGYDRRKGFKDRRVIENEIVGRRKVDEASKQGEEVAMRVRRESGLLGGVILMLMLAILCGTSGVGALEVEAGTPASFEVSVPEANRAGDPSEIRIVVRDAQGNIVKDYDRIGEGILLEMVPVKVQHLQTEPVSPERFSAGAFEGGVLRARVVFKSVGLYYLRVRARRFPAVGRSSRFSIEPGPPASIEVFSPAEARVGEPIEIAVEVKDRYGNPVSGLEERAGEVKILPAAVGAVGSFDPAKIPLSYFENGRARVKVRYNQAEKTPIEVEFAGIAGRSHPIHFRAGALAEVVVSVPRKPVPAGEPFLVALEARDAAGNTITDFNKTGNVLRLSTSGSGHLTPAAVSPSEFEKGLAMISVRYDRAEKVRVIVSDASGVKRGESREWLKVTGGRIERLEVLAASEARAGEPLAVQVVAYDRFGNLVSDPRDENLRLTVRSTDGSEIEAPVVTARDFRSGTAFFTVKCFKTGTLALQVVDAGKGIAGQSAAVTVLPAAVASYRVEAPQSAIANDPFEVAVVALDRFGNVVTDYDRTGSPVLFVSDGNGDLEPSEVGPAAFEEGVALVKVRYNTAESIHLDLLEKAGTATGKSGAVLVTSSEPARFRLVIPPRAAAGEPVKVSVTALDEFGNAVAGYSRRGARVALYTEQGAPVAPPLLESEVFHNGVAEVEVTFLETGDQVLVAREIGSKILGRSEKVHVIPSRPAQLVVSVPESVSAGDLLPVRIEMRDRLGNKIRDYSPASASLSVEVRGEDGRSAGDVFEIEGIANMVFREGVAEIVLRARKAGRFSVAVEDQVLRIEGKSSVFTVEPGPAVAFDIRPAESGKFRAGELLKFRITARDSFSNIVKNFGNDGTGLRLRAVQIKEGRKTAASGTLLPSNLQGALFSNGSAGAYLVYDKAEEIDFEAAVVPPGVLGNPEVVFVTAEERAGGTRLSLLGNGPLSPSSVRRITDSLLELRLKGATLAHRAISQIDRIGFVSLVNLVQDATGVRVLIHASAPASLRTGTDGNALLIDVEPVVSGVELPAPVILPRGPRIVPLEEGKSAKKPGTVGKRSVPSKPVSAETLKEIRRLVTERRYSEARDLVERALRESPGNTVLEGIRSRLRVLESVVGGGGSTPKSVSKEKGKIPALQPATEPVKNTATRSAIEGEIRAGRYREALTLIDQYLSSHPEDKEIQRMRGRIETMLRFLRTPAEEER
ncbi:MAG: hypothetical protein D6679_06160 [Candidatus Hydrogenedentota bacterium]|nr:MAG: hypothetical protein D6679_06160 [Candidatus Hydrogenedentota bacterium]